MASLRNLNCLFNSDNKSIKLFHRDFHVASIKYYRMTNNWVIDVQFNIIANLNVYHEINLRNVLFSEQGNVYEKDFQFDIDEKSLKARKRFLYKSKRKIEFFGIVDIMDSIDLASNVKSFLISGLNECQELKLN